MTDYKFKIIYHSETVNVVVNTLTRKHDKLVTQKRKNIAAHTQLFLNSDCVIALIKEGSLNSKQSSDNWAKLTENPYQLMNQILQTNWSHKSLNQYCQLTKKKEWGWKLQDSLFTQFEKLMMLNINALQTHLINEAHSTLITAHSDKTKTVKLLSVQYYWLSLLNVCSIFVVNCWTCC